MANVYVVGGAVRDVLQGKSPSDIDYVWVGATEEEILQLRSEWKQVGVDFPVFLDCDGNEHALARTERKTGIGYNGFDVCFDSSVTLEDDLFRRDLTINAMAVHALDWERFVADPNPNLLIDPYGGYQHLQQGLICPVSNHFKDDPLRAIRALRFAANYEFTLTSNLIENIQNIDVKDYRSISKERFLQEWLKVDITKIPIFWGRFLHFGLDRKIFGREFCKLDKISPTRPNIRCSHGKSKQFIELANRFISCCHLDDSNHVLDTLKALQLPKDVISFISFFIKFKNVDFNTVSPYRTLKELIKIGGSLDFVQDVAIKYLELLFSPDVTNEWLKLIHIFRTTKLSETDLCTLNGPDLAAKLQKTVDAKFRAS